MRTRRLGKKLLKMACLVVVHARAQRAEEVDRLAGEGVDDGLHVQAADAVVLEDAHADADPVLPGGGPVELLHAAVADEGRVQRGEVVARADDGDAGDGLVLVHAGQLHVGGVVGDVHERRVDHLVVDGVLRPAAHATGASVQVIDEQGRHAAWGLDGG